ncbi:MAG TPA: AAA family ATPase [Solirubrobacteraceae bacterium]|nr:AAA family ATPase [Solirubrobacteraceae bacterium]
MRLTHISADGILSFEKFGLPLDRRITTIVGPNGAGKSNVIRLLELVRTAVGHSAESTQEQTRLLETFLAARRLAQPPTGAKVSLRFELTEEHEQLLVVGFVKTAAAVALVGNSHGVDSSAVEEWVERQITAEKLKPLFSGEIVLSCRNTPRARWDVRFEFEARSGGAQASRIAWSLSGADGNLLLRPEDIGRMGLQRDQLAGQLLGNQGMRFDLPGVPNHDFSLATLLPSAGRGTFCDIGQYGESLPAVEAFASLLGLDQFPPAPSRSIGLATVFSEILERALILTSDDRLLPSGAPWLAGRGMRLGVGAEELLLERLFTLKNGHSADYERYRQVQKRFCELTHGRQVDVGAEPARAPDHRAPDHNEQTPQDAAMRREPRALVSVGSVPPSQKGPVEQVPIELAGAGAWEALTLASALSAEPASVIALDEPAVGLHPTLQRRLRQELQEAKAQYIVVTHSPYMLPLDPAGQEVRLVRFDRDQRFATCVHQIDDDLFARVSKKLVAKGNEGLLFASRAVLCEGETDVAAVRTLAARAQLPLDETNVAVLDCGSRDNLPDYIMLCDALGIEPLVITDADSTKAQNDCATEKRVAKVKQASDSATVTVPLFQFHDDLETALNVKTKAREEIVKACETVDLDKNTEIKVLIDKLRSFLQ